MWAVLDCLLLALPPFQREALRICTHRAAPAPLRSVSEPEVERLRQSGAVPNPRSAGWGQVPRPDAILRRANNRESARASWLWLEHLQTFSRAISSPGGILLFQDNHF
jgi:hypothetical protein